MAEHEEDSFIPVEQSWGFPKIRGTFFGVLLIRTIVY